MVFITSFTREKRRFFWYYFSKLLAFTILFYKIYVVCKAFTISLNGEKVRFVCKAFTVSLVGEIGRLSASLLPSLLPQKGFTISIT